MQVRPNDRGCVSTLLPFGSVGRGLKKHLNSIRDEAKDHSRSRRRVCRRVEFQSPSGLLPFHPVPKLTLAERRTLLPRLRPEP
jgi:hypothetical protein